MCRRQVEFHCQSKLESCIARHSSGPTSLASSPGVGPLLFTVRARRNERGTRRAPPTALEATAPVSGGAAAGSRFRAPPQVLREQVGVGPGRRLHVPAAQDALHPVRIHSRTEEQRRRRVAEPVEGHVAGDGPGPHPHATASTPSLLAVLGANRVISPPASPASSAHVLVPLDEARPLERCAQDGHGVEVFAPPSAVGRWEDELAVGSRLERVPQEEPERSRHRDRVPVPTLGRLPAVRTRHADGASGEVHRGLLQAE